MATKDLKPRPTEYKGIVYRSKSEAMFAAYLETLVGIHHIDGFRYEPKCFQVDGWIPDFAGWKMFIDDDSPGVAFRIYEYKPSYPTETYIGDFERRSYAIVRRFNTDVFRVTSFIIQYGSVWNDERGWILFTLGEEDGDFELFRSDVTSDWVCEIEDVLRNVRFDLKCHAQNGA